LKHAHHDEFTTEFELSQDELLGKRDERRLVELNGYIIRDDKTIIDVKIVDLSYDGCAVRTLQPLRIGEKIKLTVLGRDAMKAVVRWYRHRRAGLLFEFDSPPRAQWPRKAKRLKVSGELALRRAGSINYRVALFDVTRFGCKCEFVQRPKIYERVWVKFDGVESIAAVVCWVEESAVGIMFTRPFHEAVFAMLLHRLKLIEKETDSDVVE
jgi:hypothetical protein